MKFIDDQRGTVTIYLVIIFLAMLLFVGVFIDLSRIKIAQNQLRRAANSSARSVMADYNSGLKNDFGLFAVNSAEANKEMQKYINANIARPVKPVFDLLDFRYEGGNASFSYPLDSTPVLKQQILEAMKYRAPVEITTGLINKFRAIGQLAGFYDEGNEKRKSLSRVEERIENLHNSNLKIKEAKKREEINREIEKSVRETDEIKLEIIKSEEERDLSIYDFGNALQPAYKIEDETVINEFNQTRQRQKEEFTRIEAEIKQTKEGIHAASSSYQRTPEAENKENGRNPYYEQELRSQAEFYKARDPEISRYFSPEIIKGTRGDFEGTGGTKADGIAGFLKNIFIKLNGQEELLEIRDELYINEYALTYFSNLTSETKGGPEYPYRHTEAEYICYGGKNPKASAVAELYKTRFALDTAAYFAFSKAPADLIARTIYALIMGSLQASVDTCKMVISKEDVPIAAMVPDNPLEKLNLTLNYRDHLRLLLLLNSDENGKLARIAELIKERSGSEPAKLFTLVNGDAEVSVKLWFLPLAGFGSMDSGPFGTRIVNGRCFIKKRVEFGY